MNESNVRSLVYELGKSFQHAWPAEIDDFLARAGSARREAVVMLCNIDLELRWGRDRQGRAEDYLRRYPAEWAASDDEALSLIAAEYAQRGEHARIEEFSKDYAGRHPDLVDHLRRQFPPTPSAPRYRDVDRSNPHASGGQADVFIAIDEQLGREVALKRIRNGRHRDPQSRARFIQEAEMTGRLEHPGIVPVYSMELEAEGQVCYAMRLIKDDGGESLHHAIERFHRPVTKDRDPGERALELRQLLGRFVSVCRTISYAHSRNILHRDLKPDNIMLGPNGETLVVDWGLARPFAGPHGNEREEKLDSPGPCVSEPSLPGGTPGYSSPEQVECRVELMGPASDVYSLGATLYSLLTGQRPPLSGPGDTANSAGLAGRVVPLRHVELKVPRALEKICLKAISTRPEDRFQTPNALADDLERWLADEPVLCWREPLSTRARRWLSRHRTFASVAAALMLATTLGLADRSRREQNHQVRLISEKARADVAEARGDKAREVERARSDELAGTIASAITLIKDDPTLNAPGLKNLRDGLLVSIQRSLFRLAEDPDAGETKLRGTIEGWKNLGLMAARQADTGAVAAARRELASAKTQVDRHPGVPVYREILAICLLNLGNNLKATGGIDEARLSFQEGSALLDPLIRDHPEEPSYRVNRAKFDLSQGQLLAAVGEVDEARLAYQRGIDRLEPLVLAHPTVDRYRADLAKGYNTLGILQSKRDSPEKALSSYRRALELRTALVHDHATVAEYGSDLARTHLNIGNLQDKAGSRGEAFRSFSTAVKILEPLCHDNPANRADRKTLATSHNSLGVWYMKGGRADADEALRSFQRALELGEALVKDEPENLEYIAELARIYSNLGALQNDVLDDPAAASISQSRALEQRKKLVSKNPAAVLYQKDLADSWLNLGIVQAALTHPDEEIHAYGEALKVRETLDQKHSDDSSNLSTMGRISHTMGLVQLRNDHATDALASLERAVGFQNRAITRSPQQVEYRDLLCDHYLVLASIQSKLDRPDDTLTTMMKIRPVCQGNSKKLYHLAGNLARYVSKYDGKVGDGSAAAENRFAEVSIETLQQAIDAGFRDAASLEKDKRFAPLRGRKQFQELLMKLHFP